MKNIIKYGLIAILFLIAGTSLRALVADGGYRVFFKDKGPGGFAPGEDLYMRTYDFHSEKSLRRRSLKAAPENRLRYEDAPLWQPYLDSLKSAGADIALHLRWENYAVVRCDSSIAKKIEKYEFVKQVTPTSSKLVRLSCDIAESTNIVSVEDALFVKSENDCGAFRYGESFEQASRLNVPALHSLGVAGSGVWIGFIDTGFQWLKHNSLKDVDVVYEYDFLYRDSTTVNQPVDTVVQHNHGTVTLSVCAGFMQDNLIGISPFSSYLLAKTEDIREERHFEEDAFAAAVEEFERLGVDVVNASLGYKIMDSTDESYAFGDLDGNTTIVARAVNHAVERGVVFVGSAGNWGPNPKTISSPADADSVISVAAMDTIPGLIAQFSSRGPNAIGKIRPHVAAPGVYVRSAGSGGADRYVNANGTSLSAPLITGCVGLILSAFPELAPWQIRDVLTKTATLADSPDNIWGFGSADVYSAALEAGIIVSPISSYKIRKHRRVLVGIDSKYSVFDKNLFVRFSGETGFEKYPLNKTPLPKRFVADIPLSRFKGEAAECYIVVDDGFSRRRSPFAFPGAEEEYYSIEPGIDKIPCGIDYADLPKIDDDNPEILLYPNVLRRSVGAAALSVYAENAKKIEIELYDIKGRRLFKDGQMRVLGGLAQFEIPVGTLPVGIYYAKISLDTDIIVKKIAIAGG